MAASFASKYKVIQKIGEGSFSEVLKCEDRQTGVQYAAKRLRKMFKTMTDVMSCAEIIAMHKLSRHPNVLCMIEYFYEAASGKVVYVFELMDMSMYEFMKMRKRCLPEARIRNYLYQMLKGLEYLHNNGLFHRDVKPENILIKFINPDNTFFYHHQIELVKLADLGSIRGIYSRPPYTEYISTRWYRPPECLLSVGYYGPKMDVWAAGCVFYEMLTLKPLFPGTNEIDQLAKIHAVLGTPSLHLIKRIKKKSHNCENFPRQVGSGFNSLMGGFSEDARQVLKLMVQYDPENRINVRRLLDHKYFGPFGDLQSRGRGDHKYFPNCLDGSNQTKGGIRKSRLITSKTTVEMAPNYMLRDGSGPLVTHRQFREWGVDPSILKAGETGGRRSSNRNGYHYQQRRSLRLRDSDPFRKTTSNLPVRQPIVKEEGGSSAGRRQFQSKSFVLPRKVDGRFKLDTINES